MMTPEQAAQWAEAQGEPEGAECAALIRRMQAVLDSRPAINGALPQSYIEWSAKVYTMELRHESEPMQ